MLKRIGTAAAKLAVWRPRDTDSKYLQAQKPVESGAERAELWGIVVYVAVATCISAYVLVSSKYGVIAGFAVASIAAWAFVLMLLFLKIQADLILACHLNPDWAIDGIEMASIPRHRMPCWEKEGSPVLLKNLTDYSDLYICEKIEWEKMILKAANCPDQSSLTYLTDKRVHIKTVDDLNREITQNRVLKTSFNLQVILRLGMYFEKIDEIENNPPGLMLPVHDYGQNAEFGPGNEKLPQLYGPDDMEAELERRKAEAQQLEKDIKKEETEPKKQR